MKPERIRASGVASAKDTNPSIPKLIKAEVITGPANGVPRLGLSGSNARRANSGRFLDCLLRSAYRGI